jgi:hypothetical protein
MMSLKEWVNKWGGNYNTMIARIGISSGMTVPLLLIFLLNWPPHQKINHFPGMNTLHRKNTLAKNLYRMYDEDPDSYNFFPRTFLLPFDNLRLRHYFQ